VRHERPGNEFGQTFLLHFAPVRAPNDFRTAPLLAGRRWDDPHSNLSLEVAASSAGLQVSVTYRATGCTYSLQPPARTVSSAAGSYYFDVITGPGCVWEAATSSSFATLGDGRSGTGGGRISFAVAANAGMASRSAAITAGGQTFQLTQEGATYQTSLSPPAATVPTGGGSGVVNVTITGQGVNWTAVSNAPWLAPTQVSGGPGSGTLTYLAAPNLGPTPRTAILTVAGASFSVTQPGVSGAGEGRVYTIAGLTPFGDSGPATAAPLRYFRRFDIDGQGNMFIAEQNSHRIRKIAADGTISTIAGDGIPISTGDGQPAANARLANPGAIAVDPQGGLLFAESGKIRKIASTGIISTVATVQEWIGGAARGPDGSYYFALPDAHKVKKLTPQGQVVDFAGTGVAGFSGDNGPAAAAQLNAPQDVIVDAQGAVYIAESLNHRIRKVAPNGTISTIAGTGTGGFSGDGGPAAQAQLYSPQGLGLDNLGNLVIVDMNNGRLRRISGGIIQTIAGTPG
jgi:hypothetical protein